MKTKWLILFALFILALFLTSGARADSIVSSGSGPLKSTWGADLDAGVLNTVQMGSEDIWWEIEQYTPSVLGEMVPVDAKGIVNLGVVNFSSITEAELAGLTYSMMPLVSSLLVNGDVFAVETKDGNFAEVEILNYGYDLSVQWATYSPCPTTATPEPSSLLLLGSGLLGAVVPLRRKVRCLISALR
jgi:PEP-CTERM motif